MLNQVERIYASSAADLGFAVLLSACPADDDEALAELIEADGRHRLRKGKPVTLDRYLAEVPDLQERPDALDAAIDVALRGLSGSARISPDAVETLVQHYPALAETIREAALLNAAVWSTSGLRQRVAPPPVRQLPCDFGPRLPSGQRRYVLEELLGQGSFGQVYKATDRQLSEEGHRAIVAIKVLADTMRSDADRQRLIEEATKVRRISHPNVVLVLDRGVSEDDQDFIVYEHVDGGDLSDLAESELPLEPRAAATLMAKVARGVHAAHSAGVIHCDLKPSNIMRTAAGEPKVADFGIAVRVQDRAPAAGVAASGSASRGPIGNIAFISPEQFRGEDAALSVPSDVYALGGILYHLLTAHLPNGTTRNEISHTHAVEGGRPHAPSPRAIAPAVDRDVDAICRRALAPRPGDRYASAASLADDLERWLARLPIDWTKPSIGRRLALWAQRKPALALASAAIFALVVAGALVAGHFASVANQKKLQVALAEMEIEKKNAEADFRARVGAQVVGALRQVQEHERFLNDMLLSMWVFEYIYGPKALDLPERLSLVWESREHSVREMLEQRCAAGQGEAIETLLLEQLLAFWLVNAGDHAEAITLLDHNANSWSKIRPDDPLLRDLQILRQCAEVNRLRDPHTQFASADERAVVVTRLHDALKREAERLERERPRSPLHCLTLSRFADTCDLLNEAEQAADARSQLNKMRDESPLRSDRATKPQKAASG